VSKMYSLLAAAGLLVSSVVPASAQSDDHVKELVAKAMQQVQSPTTPAPTGQLLDQAGPTVNLTEQEAVTRARENNLNLASERLTPRTWDFTMMATRANYAFNLTSGLIDLSSNRFTNDVISGGIKNTTDRQTWSGGIRQNMWWGGGNYNLSWTNNHTSTNSTNSTCNPCFDSGLTGTYTQPLMRNFKIDNTRAAIRTNEISQDIADLNLTSLEVSTLAQTRNAYWELVYARQAVEAAQRSLDLASKLVSDNRSKVEIGTMAPIDVVQAQAEEASRRQQLVNAQATLRNNELALKRLIVRGTDDDIWKATIIPTDRPVVTALPIDLESAVRNALGRRTDIATTKKNLESGDITLKSLQNQTLPQLDFQASLGLAGQAGVSVPRRDPVSGDIITVPPGGYLDTLAGLGKYQSPTWTFRLDFAYPLGVNGAKANAARQKIVREQTEASMKTLELQIATEVTAAALAVRNSLESLQASILSRELSEKRLEAAASKFEVGMATNFEVVQAQRDLNDARNAELRQQLNYQRALVDFERVQISPR
jgi:outer membrane protein